MTNQMKFSTGSRYCPDVQKFVVHLTPIEVQWGSLGKELNRVELPFDCDHKSTCSIATHLTEHSISYNWEKCALKKQ